MLLTEVQLTRPLGRVLRVLRLSPLIDVLDTFVAQYRKRLGRFVPEGPGYGGIPDASTTSLCAL